MLKLYIELVFMVNLAALLALLFFKLNLVSYKTWLNGSVQLLRGYRRNVIS
jgi:hypothetical protein